MMDWQRSSLIAAIVLVFGYLFIQWNEFKEATSPVSTNPMEESVFVPEEPGVLNSPSGDPSMDSEIPEVSPVRETALPESKINGGRLVQVQTDVLDLTIDTVGGDIVRAALRKHLSEQSNDGKPYVILNRTRSHTYVAQSGLIGPNGTDRKGQRPVFRTRQTEYKLEQEQEELIVTLELDQPGAKIFKHYVFYPGEYLIGVRYEVQNLSDNPWQAYLFGQVKRDTSDPNTANAMGPRPYLGMAVNTEETNYKKLDFEDLDEAAFKTEKLGGWVAMVQHYFVSAWVPGKEDRNHYQLRRLGSKSLYTAGFTGPLVEVAPGQSGSLQADFYVGPKNQQRLADISEHLDLTIDYGWLWWVAKPLFWGLDLINQILNNWGWSIVMLTVVVKGIFYPLSAASYRSMARMRKLQPEMLRLKELYGDDRQKMSQETMNLYKREKVNPVGGCLPMLIQMPVFIALYWVLNESVELRHSPWILWITDLSVKDPFYVLPVLNGISMYVLQTLQPAPPDPMQAKVMKIMPVAFSFFFMFFPAGLVLYWTVNSILSIAQQWIITRRIESEP